MEWRIRDSFRVRQSLFAKKYLHNSQFMLVTDPGVNIYLIISKAMTVPMCLWGSQSHQGDKPEDQQIAENVIIS